MFLWFLGGSVLVVWMVFQTPSIDYRMVAAASVLPLVDAVFGGPRVLHTLLAAVALMVIVVLGTVGRRLRRRQWLALPIGVFLHLVLDGTWADPEQFWWPAQGSDFEIDGLVEWSRGWVGIVMELAGALAIWWMVTRFGLGDRDRRREFLSNGQLDRALAREQAPPSC